MKHPENIIEKYYANNPEAHSILLTHSRQVADRAVQIALRHPEFIVDIEFVYEAALLHDIGIFLCNAPRIFCFGENQYIQHGYLGAELLRSEGLDRHALVCERHTGVGISLDIIESRNLPLPHRDMRPISNEEILICYADKFFSKTQLENEHSIERIIKGLNRHGVEDVEQFNRWYKMFK